MKQVIKQLKKSKRVAIIAHISPDPDCLSSMTALSCILQQFGKQTQMFVDTDCQREMMSFYNLPKGYDADIDPKNFDTIVTVDIPSIRQTGKHYQVISNFDNVVSIDHHASRDLPAKYKYVDASKSSCSEIIFELARKMHAKITPYLAGLIFAGIVGDTNCFQNDNITENSFKVSAECLKYGADKNRILFVIHKHQTYEEIALRKLGYQNMKVKNQIAYVTFTKKMFNECGVEDCPMFVNEMLNTADNKIAFVIKQKEKNTYTVSLRCKDKYNIAKVAEAFGGGGHEQASGCGFTGSLEKYTQLIFDECLKEIQQKDATGEV